MLKNTYQLRGNENLARRSVELLDVGNLFGRASTSDIFIGRHLCYDVRTELRRIANRTIQAKITTSYGTVNLDHTSGITSYGHMSGITSCSFRSTCRALSSGEIVQKRYPEVCLERQ